MHLLSEEARLRSLHTARGQLSDVWKRHSHGGSKRSVVAVGSGGDELVEHRGL